MRFILTNTSISALLLLPLRLWLQTLIMLMVTSDMVMTWMTGVKATERPPASRHDLWSFSQYLCGSAVINVSIISVTMVMLMTILIVGLVQRGNSRSEPLSKASKPRTKYIR